MLMGCLKDTDNISGLMEVFIEVISSRVLDMAMVFGRTANKYFKECIVWIRKKVSESINGRRNKFIEGSLNKTLEMAMANFIQSVKINLKS
jgi:hypothetical protein